MTIPTLPTELLVKIFSVVSSPSDLYHILRASKRFASISRSFLYDHVIIETKRQREELKNVRDVDKISVKKLTIKGDGPIDMEDMEEHFRSCTLGEGCVEDLFSGQLLWITSELCPRFIWQNWSLFKPAFTALETLHIVDVHMQPSICAITNSYRVVNAANLVELSICAHQGAGDFWRIILDKDILPRLRRLGYRHVSDYRSHLIDSGENTESPDDSDEERILTENDVQLTSILSMTGLDVVVCLATDCPPVLRKFSYLPIIPHDFPRGWVHLALSKEDNVRLFATPRPILPPHLFTHALQYAIGFPPTFLSLPYPRSQFSDAGQKALSEIERLGTEVHFDEEEDLDSTSLIPRHFVDYVARMKRLKMEEEEKV